MRVALDEFATRGYHDAPLNRVIDAAGISKASMYYDVLSIAERPG
ncbi:MULTISPECIES: TetR family transcriptional regulator [Arthrobacter]|nr:MULTISPECIES: TetR family transcriptional regulator [Arthrobacter]MBT8159524.1 TetR/AcrR family transcriptional regulator [Arthrobacter sp. GN70]